MTSCFLLANKFLVRLSGWYLVIHIYLKVSENCTRRIFEDIFWFVHIYFVSDSKFYFLAQLPIDHLPAKSCQHFHFFFYMFAAFAYCVSPHNLHLQSLDNLYTHSPHKLHLQSLDNLYTQSPHNLHLQSLDNLYTQSPHNLHLTIFCILSIIVLIQFLLICF